MRTGQRLGGLIPDAPPEPSRTLGSLAWLAELWLGTCGSSNRAVVGSCPMNVPPCRSLPRVLSQMLEILIMFGHCLAARLRP